MTQPKPVVLYHTVYATEDFDHAARAMFELVRSAQQQQPDQPRVLILDIEGHRNDTGGGFDPSMFELQKEFALGFLSKHLTEISMPLGRFRTTTPQDNDVPDALQINPIP